MKYPKLMTLKSTQEINRLASKLARNAGRSRSAYVRDVIQTLDKRQDLRDTVKKALPTVTED